MIKLRKLILGIIFFYICEAIIITPLPIGRFFDFDYYQHYDSEPITFSSKDRVLIISPHPDDAVLSSGGVIQKAKKAGAMVKIVYITYGSHNETSIIKENKLKLLTLSGAIKLGEKRHKEAINAVKLLGVKKNDVVFLGFPDFGTLKMWTDDFKDKSYFSGLTLHNRVFYRTADNFGAPFRGEAELLALKSIISNFSPTKIFYPSLLDLNSDHRATGLFVEAAMSDLNLELKSIPIRYTYLIHSKNWPQPFGYFPNLSFYFPNYIRGLPPQGIYTVSLNKDEEDFKKEAIECHKSQLISNKDFMYSFVRNNELFFTPHIYNFNEYLPLWAPKVLQKINIIPCIKSVILTSDSKYIYYNVKFYSGVPLYTKVNLFVYEKSQGKLFENSPRYKFIVIKSILDNKLYYKIKDDNRLINPDLNDFRVDIENDSFIIKIDRKYFSQTDFLLSSLEIKKGDVRVAETPWWRIKI